LSNQYSYTDISAFPEPEAPDFKKNEDNIEENALFSSLKRTWKVCSPFDNPVVGTAVFRLKLGTGATPVVTLPA
jgi:hypothetical protein